MISARHWIFGLSLSLVASVVSITGSATSARAISFVNDITIPGESKDLYEPSSNSANINRLGFLSDLYYDRYNNVYYGLADRGPGGGVLPYKTRVQKFTLDVDRNSGTISNFKLQDTILFTQDGENFNGLDPKQLNGNVAVLGKSFDPEGFVVAPNGNFYVADEYGPSVYEFSPTGSFIRAFETPSNLIPKSDGTINYVDGSPDITSGRQDNRGFEGVTLSPDGRKLYAVLQDALVNEGSPDGRRSRHLRLVEFNTATGQSTSQYIYQLEALADINSRVPEDTFGANAQGRNIGVSAITALNNDEFLVLERDNRGVGVEDPKGESLVASKRVYKISLTGATDVSKVITGTNDLSPGVTPVSKSISPFIDIAELLKAKGLVIPEKLEGLASGPQLADGSYAILLGTDNDFSVTQNDDDVQFDVCTDGSDNNKLDSGCQNGASLLPTYLYSFKASREELKGFVRPTKVPEPTTTAGLMLLGLSSFLLKRQLKLVKK